jgi:hypothetical protein
MMSSNFSRYILVLFGVMLMSPSAALCQPKKIVDLSKRSDIVAVGKVASLKSEWTPDKQRIETRVTLSVDEYVKGAAGNSMEVVVPGGEVGAVGELYTHMPKFSQGEEVVVFVSKDKKGRFRVVGGSDGKYDIEHDSLTGKPVVAGRKPLDEFKAEIKAAARE